MQLIELIKNPWPWYVAGPLLSLVLFALLYFGKTFGFSSNFRSICAIAGGGKYAKFFDYDWKAQTWNLVFLVGTIIGAFIAINFLMNNSEIILNPKTSDALMSLGIDSNNGEYLPSEIFSIENLSSLKNIMILLMGGFLVGFGTRYAGGCTSGHAITGLSQLQIPSLIAVIGFFIGGLIMTHFLIPIIL